MTSANYQQKTNIRWWRHIQIVITKKQIRRVIKSTKSSVISDTSRTRWRIHILLTGVSKTCVIIMTSWATNHYVIAITWRHQKFHYRVATTSIITFASVQILTNQNALTVIILIPIINSETEVTEKRVASNETATCLLVKWEYIPVCDICDETHCWSLNLWEVVNISEK